MAQQGNEVRFCCSICLDLLKDPVTIPCGHNYCMNCIKIHWDEEDQKNIHSCPQCRQTFIPRPVLKRNTMLAELVEKLKKTGLQAAPADHCYAGPEDVACDVCTGRKLKAFKSCLVCLASYCEQHLQPHYESPTFKKHKLVEASAKLQDTICSRHDKVMEMFCRTDQQCICYLCSVDEHKGHDTVSAAAERTERQRELEVSRLNIQQRIQDREKDVKELQQKVEAINGSADKAVEDSEKIFTELIRLMEKRRSDVKQQVRSQQETEVSRVKDLQKKLEQEITELMRKDAELVEVSHTEDHNQFLHNYPSLPRFTRSAKSTRPNSVCLQCFKDVTATVAVTRDRIMTVLSDEWMSQMKMDVVLQPKQPTTRAEFLQYSQRVTLDPNTAHRDLVLSDGNKKVTVDSMSNRKHSSHPDRFTHSAQVLSKDGMTERCYWEVKANKFLGVAVAYKSIGRSWDCKSQGFGSNEKSWALYCINKGYMFIHDKWRTPVSGPESSIIGVYLDHREGILSFYSVSETMTLLHRVQTRFTEPLYAGLSLQGPPGVTAELF